MEHNANIEGPRDAERPHRPVLTPWMMLGFSFAILIGLLLIARQDLVVWWHRRQMQAGWDATYDPDNSISEGGMLGYSLGDEWEQYEYHRDKLVDLGEIDLHRFKCEHLIDQSDESSHFLKRLLRGDGPDCLYWESPHSDTPQPLMLILWCEPPESEAWREFIEGNDVPDYRERYMTDLSDE